MSKSGEIDLKPCPFCGHRAYLQFDVVRWVKGMPRFRYRADCDHCKIGTEWMMQKARVIKRWNRRVG